MDNEDYAPFRCFKCKKDKKERRYPVELYAISFNLCSDCAKELEHTVFIWLGIIPK